MEEHQQTTPDEEQFQEWEEEYNDEALRNKPLDQPNNLDRQRFPHNVIACITWTNRTAPKSSSTTSLSSPSPEYPSHGTSFFIAPDLILTCAHNLFNIKKKQPSLKVCFSLGDNHSSLHTVQIKQYRFPEEYKGCEGQAQNKASLEYDYALIKIDKPVKLEKYFALCLNFSNELEKVSTFGYPEFTIVKENGVDNLSCSQRGDFGHLPHPYTITLHQWKMKHLLNTREGLSGSPIILQNTNQVVAIHKASVVNKEDRATFLYNVARRVTPDMVSNIRKWAEEMKSNPAVIALVDYQKERGEQFLSKWKQQGHLLFSNSVSSKLVEKQNERFPYNCIGYIQNKSEEGIVCGTGFLIAPNLVLTLLPSIFSRFSQYLKGVEKTKVKEKSIVFYCSSSDKCSSVMQLVEVEEIAANPECLQPGNNFVRNHITSYCLLKLKKKVIREKYFRLALSHHLQEETLELAGYVCPYQPTYNSLQDFNRIPKFQIQKRKTLPNNVQTQTSLKMIRYNGQTHAGMCGSPLWNQKGDVVAIHHGVLKEGPPQPVGRAITTDLLWQLYQWKHMFHGCEFSISLQEQGQKMKVMSAKTFQLYITNILSRSLGYG